MSVAAAGRSRLSENDRGRIEWAIEEIERVAMAFEARRRPRQWELAQGDLIDAAISLRTVLLWALPEEKAT